MTAAPGAGVPAQTGPAQTGLAAQRPAPLDRSPLRAALQPGSPGHTLAAVLIAAAGLGLPGDLDVAAAAANLGVHPARVRSWMRRSHDERHAAAALTGLLQARYGAAPSPAGAAAPIDPAMVAADQGVHLSTARRWLRGSLTPAAAADVVYRLLASTGPAPVSSKIGSVNVTRTAQLLSCSASTVRRWLRTGTLPQAKAEQVLELTAPSAQVLVREALDVEHALDCIQRLNLGRGRGGMNAQYGSTGWLEPHIVSILDTPGTGLRRVAVTRVNARPLQRLRQNAAVADFSAPLPHKFAAELVRHDVLDAVSGWRVEAAAGAIDSLPRGRTQAWVATAPAPGLSALARARQ